MVDDGNRFWYTAGWGFSHETRNAGYADGLAGTWNASGKLGCILVTQQNPVGHPDVYTLSAVWPGTSGVDLRSLDTYLDARLENPSCWADGEGRLHVYGLTEGTLRVVHQAGVALSESVAHPVWDTHPLTVDGSDVDVAVTRAVVSSVDTWAVDPFPDDYPSQHVMHDDDVPAGERCAIYTQDVTTTWWSREVVRLPAVTKMYRAMRYGSQVTLTSALGAPVPDYPVSLTSDLPVDLEIGGRFYRCGPNHSVTVRTDASGQLTTRVVARNLTGTSIHIAAVGLSDGTSFNPATEVHRFLGGSGTLPTYPDGISETILHDAKKSDGTWVFPAWHQPMQETGLATVPDAGQVLEWCAIAFRAAEQLERPSVVAEDGTPVPVRGIVLQTWDDSRPAYEVVTSPERQAEIEDATQVHPRFAGDWDDGDYCVGDLFEGIAEGTVRVVEVGFDYASRLATLGLEWLEGKWLRITLLWDQSDNPVQFVQAVFNALLAEAEDIIDWLKFVFDWSDIVATKEALLDGISQMSVVTQGAFDYAKSFIDGWFAAKEQDVKEFFDNAKKQLTGTTFERKPPPAEVTIPPESMPPPSVVDPVKGLGPNVNWLQDKIISSAQGDFTPVLAEGVPAEFQFAVDALQAVFDVFENDDVGREFSQALDDLGSLVSNLFDGSDPQTLARTEIVTFLDLVEHLILAVLTLADAVILKAITVIETGLACIPKFLEMHFLDDTFLGWLWEFVCDAAGIEYTSPTVADVFVTMVAFPMTVVSKAVLGTVPFPDGFPDLLSTAAPRVRPCRRRRLPVSGSPTPTATSGPRARRAAGRAARVPAVRRHRPDPLHGGGPLHGPGRDHGERLPAELLRGQGAGRRHLHVRPRLVRHLRHARVLGSAGVHDGRDAAQRGGRAVVG